MKREQRFSPPMVGGSSLLVIFAVLALSVFAVLCLSTAQAENRLSDASAQAVTAYYEADREAERLYAMLRSGASVPQAEQNGSVWRYTCPISAQQVLLAEVEYTNGMWSVLRWQAVAVPDGTSADDALNVWDGVAP